MRFKLRILAYLALDFLLGMMFGGKRSAVLLRIRERRLLRFLRHSPYYAPRLHPATRLEDLPVVDKKAYMAAFDAINTVGLTREEAYAIALEAERTRDFSPEWNGITIGLSSGTSGHRGLFLASEAERARWVAMVLRRVIGLSLKRRSVAFFLRANSTLYTAVHSRLLDFQYFDLLHPMDDLLARLHRLQPDILVAQPAVLERIVRAMEAGTISIRPTKVISVAEVLDPEDADRFTKAFGVRIQQVYQATEGFLASSCRYGTLHLHEDFLRIERRELDGSGRFMPIVTDTLRRTQPIVRYVLNDLLHPQAGCPCGSPHLALSRIEGRADDVLRFIGREGERVEVFPDLFRNTLLACSSTIREYIVQQTAPDAVHLYIESDDPADLARAETAVRTLLASRNVVEVRIAFLPSPPHQQAEKRRRIRYDAPHPV